MDHLNAGQVAYGYCTINVLPFQIVWIEEGLHCHTEVDKVAEVQHVQFRLDGRVLKIPEKLTKHK